MAKKTRSRRSRKPTTVKPANRARPFIIGGSILIGIAGLVALLVLSLREPAQIHDIISFGSLSRGHDDTLTYAQSDLPPAGGVHHGAWQNCGIYTEPIQAENAVHSLEHGAVWITYQPGLPDTELAALQALVRSQTYLLLSPFPGLRSPIVATAWGFQLELESAQDDRLPQFIQRYRQGPTSPERLGSCTGGVGSPLS